MKKQHCGYSLIALSLLAMSGAAAATDLNVNFTANIRETTCDMKLVGGEGSNTAQTLTLGNNGQARIDDIRAGNVTAKFKIAIIDCPSSLRTLKTTVKGSPASYLKTGLVNQLKGAGFANYSAVEIARESASTAPFTVNSTDDSKRLVWTQEEITNKEVPLIATLRETSANELTIGQFQTVGTFEFTYE
ncbi:fimbrial protein [Enterobacter quasihormaechei]|uniref:fimbrial protein n=1 Tax=Enterobacter quasihormaechei TaxID=2529382 RepID=UPI002FD1118E